MELCLVQIRFFFCIHFGGGVIFQVPFSMFVEPRGGMVNFFLASEDGTNLTTCFGRALLVCFLLTWLSVYEWTAGILECPFEKRMILGVLLFYVFFLVSVGKYVYLYDICILSIFIHISLYIYIYRRTYCSICMYRHPQQLAFSCQSKKNHRVTFQQSEQRDVFSPAQDIQETSYFFKFLLLNTSKVPIILMDYSENLLWWTILPDYFKFGQIHFFKSGCITFCCVIFGDTLQSFTFFLLPRWFI